MNRCWCLGSKIRPVYGIEHLGSKLKGVRFGETAESFIDTESHVERAGSAQLAFGARGIAEFAHAVERVCGCVEVLCDSLGARTIGG